MKYLASYGLKEVELKQEVQKFDAADALYVPLTEYKRLNPFTTSPLSTCTPRYKRNLSVESRFEDALKRERSETTEGERMEEELSEAEEEMDTRRPQLKRRRLIRTVVKPHENYYRILLKMNGPTRRRHLWKTSKESGVAAWER